MAISDCLVDTNILLRIARREDPDHAAVELQAFERSMRLLPDYEAVYLEWRRLVVAHSVSGVQVHDARLAAAMLVHRIPYLLTLNARDFARYPGITALHPSEVTDGIG